jgi:hypothetical protein
VHLLTEKNRRDRVRICQENLAKFKSGAWRIYDVVTGDESWFYWRQIGRKQSNASWVAEGESPRTVVKRGRFEDKTMVCIFFRTSGVDLITYWDRGGCVDHKTYIDDCLKPLVRLIKTSRKTLGTKKLKFHHDNARPHVHQAVITYLKEQGFTLPYPTPSDLWPFDYIKQRLDSHSSSESLVHQITAIVKAIPKEEYLKTFHKWIERMELCIKYKGDYFEHIINK